MDDIECTCDTGICFIHWEGIYGHDSHIQNSHQRLGGGKVETPSCPCSALPEGMVVVRRDDLERLKKDTWDHFGKEYLKRLRAALEKKP